MLTNTQERYTRIALQMKNNEIMIQSRENDKNKYNSKYIYEVFSPKINKKDYYSEHLLKINELLELIDDVKIPHSKRKKISDDVQRFSSDESTLILNFSILVNSLEYQNLHIQIKKVPINNSDYYTIKLFHEYDFIHCEKKEFFHSEEEYLEYRAKKFNCVSENKLCFDKENNSVTAICNDRIDMIMFSLELFKPVKNCNYVSSFMPLSEWIEHFYVSVEEGLENFKNGNPLTEEIPDIFNLFPTEYDWERYFSHIADVSTFPCNVYYNRTSKEFRIQ